jgi:hypothetical protein
MEKIEFWYKKMYLNYKVIFKGTNTLRPDAPIFVSLSCREPPVRQTAQLLSSTSTSDQIKRSAF